ncbi:MAG: FAD-dependent oxidoreductase [Candidatus Spechtbacterales bacterium]
MHDFLIIGGGPAAAAAGVYASRKKLNTILIAEEWGGQSVVSAGIENWIGTKNVSGLEFAKMLEGHVRAQEDIEIVMPDKVTKVEKSDEHFNVFTEKGNSYETRTVFVASGAHRKKLGVPGEKEFDGKGVAYCSTCDAPIFKGKDVAIIGGGNAGLEAVLDLGPYAKNIWLLEYSDKLKGDQVTQEKVKNLPNLKEIILNVETREIFGNKFVTGLKYRDRKTGEEKELAVQGVFVEIGSLPNSDMVKDLVETNKYGEIIINSKNARTSTLGIWAAGDVTDDPFKQNNISAGDAVKAALDAYNYLTLGDR